MKKTITRLAAGAMVASLFLVQPMAAMAAPVAPVNAIFTDEGGTSMEDAQSFSIGDTVKVNFTDKSLRETRFFVFETDDTNDNWYIFKGVVPTAGGISGVYDILDSDGVSLADKINTYSNYEAGFKLKANSTYYLTIRNDYNTGTYSVKTSSEPDDAGENEGEALEIVSGKKYNLHTSTSYDRDWFTFEAGLSKSKLRITSKMKDYLRWTVYDEDMVKVTSGSVGTNSADDETIDTKKGSRYYIEIYAGYYGGYGDYTLTVDSGKAGGDTGAPTGKVTINSVTAGTKQATVKYTGVSGADGYVIFYTLDPNFKQFIKLSATTGTTCTIKNLQSGKFYYFLVRPFVNVAGGKKYGALSDVKAVKIK